MKSSMAMSCPSEPSAANSARVPAAMAIPANEVKSQSSQTSGAFMPSRPTDTRSRMPVRIGTSTRATAHFDSKVWTREMATGMRWLHFGPISVTPYPSAPSTVVWTRIAPRNPHMMDSSET